MSDKRKDDPLPYTKFRADRFFREGEHWYFQTREGTTEGPFANRTRAEERLRDYIRAVDSGYLSDGCSLSLEPLD